MELGCFEIFLDFGLTRELEMINYCWDFFALGGEGEWGVDLNKWQGEARTGEYL